MCREDAKSAPVALGEKSRFSVSLVRGGAAERAGVRQGDLLVWMNGATVCGLTHVALSRMVRNTSALVSLSTQDHPNDVCH